MTYYDRKRRQRNPGIRPPAGGTEPTPSAPVDEKPAEATDTPDVEDPIAPDPFTDPDDTPSDVILDD